jgi:hypothetical protein
MTMRHTMAMFLIGGLITTSGVAAGAVPNALAVVERPAGAELTRVFALDGRIVAVRRSAVEPGRYGAHGTDYTP